MKNDNSPATAYEQFKLEWMLAHGYTLQDLVAELENLREAARSGDVDAMYIFADWEYGYGFGSEIWPCFDEFLDCEYKERTACGHDEQ